MTPHDIGHAAVFLSRSAEKQAADRVLSYGLQGRLVLSPSGYVLLEVPNDIGNGAFKALNEPGVEQPVSNRTGRYNAHISVIRPEELEAIGGPGKLTQRGQSFSFNLGAVREISNPHGWVEMSKVWVIDAKSPELMKLRRSLGLGDPKFPFHITFAVRRKNALKSASLIHAKYSSCNTAVKASDIHGKGLFAQRDFKIGDVICPKLMVKAPSKDDRIRWEQSEDARYTNHSGSPNTEIIADGDYVKMKALQDIKSGEELTADYIVTTKRLGGSMFYYTYRGKPYGDQRQEKEAKISEESVADEAQSVLEDAVNRNQKRPKTKEYCSGCGRKFKKNEPYPDVTMCEVCERYGPTLVKEGNSLALQIASARKVTESPKSKEQAEAGNYRKGKVRMHGLQITLENPKGSTRSGTDPSGKKWSIKMQHDYGYINRTEGRDGDHVDVFIGPDPDTELIYVVDQQDPTSKRFDEHKCMFGFKTKVDAQKAYLSNYEDGWGGLRSITALTLPQFKWWLQKGDTTKPVDGAKIKIAADSFYLNAINQVPMTWDTQRGVINNLMQNLNRVKDRGDRSIQEAAANDRLLNAANPNRANQQLLAYLRGTRTPLVHHPLDRFVQNVGS